MKTMWIVIVMMTLAAPAMAIDKGECCADVNGICISKCTKPTCTGNGDCVLALTSAPAGVDSSSRAFEIASRTLGGRDRGELDRLFAAELGDGGGTAAIGKGECCAKVHNVCISSCQKSSCTGHGDCDLVLTAKPQGSASSPEVRGALKTLAPRDQATLKRGLKAKTTPPPPPVPNGRPDTEPTQGIHDSGVGQVGGFKAPPGGQFLPSLKQTGGITAKVPLKHGSCLGGNGQPILDSGNHVLAVTSGNLNVPAKIEMSCPPGHTVVHLSYQLEGQNAVNVVGGDSGQASVSQNLPIQPFSSGELEAACQQAFGGCWAEPGSHHNNSKTAKKTIKETVRVWGQCSGWANKQLRTYPVALTVTCEDQSFFVPVP